MRMAMKSDIGRIRMVNEDRAAINEDLNGFSVAIVADGMGGHQAGDVASQITIEVIQEELQNLAANMSVDECQHIVRKAISEANKLIYDVSRKRDHYNGMGTTVVVAITALDWVVIAHIGDSRAYQVNGQSINQLTSDHSLVNELMKSGQITESEATVHPQRNVLMRALGTDEEVEVDVQSISWHAGDHILLCSDGLTNLVSEQMIRDILTSDISESSKVERLIEEALEAGGDDNVTVVILTHS
jgi:serine/threonine protein phosphatase PrpC